MMVIVILKEMMEIEDSSFKATDRGIPCSFIFRIISFREESQFEEAFEKTLQRDVLMKMQKSY